MPYEEFRCNFIVMVNAVPSYPHFFSDDFSNYFWEVLLEFLFFSCFVMPSNKQELMKQEPMQTLSGGSFEVQRDNHLESLK